MLFIPGVPLLVGGDGKGRVVVWNVGHVTLSGKEREREGYSRTPFEVRHST
eukprot:GABW01004624.1.p1 GENE.GABW01004624.1~~GABW01004624.1.p1  ORF type:complete len:51 (-),score=17.45 GABW01004624.1:3-155(-)